jgi:phosphatidylglycerophosphatase A
MMFRLGLFIASVGYVGYAPVAPGTFGSAAGLAVFYAVRAIGTTAVEAAAIAVLTALGVWSASLSEHYIGGKDPGPVVIDEVVGMLITLAFLPVTPLGALTGFLLFRLLDVVSLPGGFGVMADDAMAGLYGNLVMRGLIWMAPAGWLV